MDTMFTNESTFFLLSKRTVPFMNMGGLFIYNPSRGNQQSSHPKIPEDMPVMVVIHIMNMAYN